MTRFKCWLNGHKFYKVGRSKVGMTIEKYVECKCCAMVITMITIHPRYKYLYEGIPRDRMPNTLYFERKRIDRDRLMQFRIKNNYGERHDSTFNKPVNP